MTSKERMLSALSNKPDAGVREWVEERDGVRYFFGPFKDADIEKLREDTEREWNYTRVVIETWKRSRV